MVRRFGLLLGMILGTFSSGSFAYASCALIDTFDKLHVIQTRLSRNPDTVLFASDIRQLRIMHAGISDRDALDAVDGNRFTGKGADFIQFLRNTQDLLQGASMDDPYSVSRHYTAANRATLAAIGTHLHALRCTADQVAIDSAPSNDPINAVNSDAEDIAEVVENLSLFADEVFRWRSVLILGAVFAMLSFTVPLVRRWLILRKRRAKRYNTTYATNYIWDDSERSGALIDINCHGAKLRHDPDAPIPKSTVVHVQIDGDWVSGTVVWVNTHYSGLQFRRMISLEKVKAVCIASESQKTAPRMQNGAQMDAA